MKIEYWQTIPLLLWYFPKFSDQKSIGKHTIKKLQFEVFTEAIMIYYRINTQYMNRLLSESPREPPPQYQEHTRARTPAQMCTSHPDSRWSYSLFNRENTTFQSTLSFEKVLEICHGNHDVQGFVEYWVLGNTAPLPC